MIKTFKNRETETIWNGETVKTKPKHIQNKALERLEQLNTATHIDDLRKPPSNHLEKLKGDRKTQWSIRVNEKWRICFSWEQE